MADINIRPVIFLYTDDAEISAATLSAMTKAGFLPVKVKDTNAVRLMEPALTLSPEMEGDILSSAMETIAKYVENGHERYAAQFAGLLAKRIKARHP